MTETGIEYDVDLRRGQKTGSVSRPAGEPRGGRRLRARPAARLLQLQRRLRAGARPLVRRDDRDRRVGGRGGPRTPERGAQRRRRRRAGRQRIRRAARPRSAGRAVRHHRARSAGLREEQGGGVERSRRLQGNQPARAEAAESRRDARHLQLLVSRQRGGVRGDRLRSRGRCAGRTSPLSRSGCRDAIIRSCSACRRPTISNASF